jgi:TetR/AcrR family transcriptional regulator, mexJK operon transcriptional repressor
LPAVKAETRPNPKREARRDAMLDAATALFLERGYGAISLTDVVKRSGGSLATLYELFGGKLGLLKACVAERCGQLNELLDASALENQPPKQALTAFGRGLLALVTSPLAVGAHRMIIAEHAQIPELAPAFWANGPDAGKEHLAHYLAHVAAQGVLDIADPLRAARHFCALVIGDTLLRKMHGIATDDSPAEAERHIDEVVGLFLRGYAPKR